jgi:hypothetical protein
VEGAKKKITEILSEVKTCKALDVTHLNESHSVQVTVAEGGEVPRPRAVSKG